MNGYQIFHLIKQKYLLSEKIQELKSNDECHLTG